MLYYTLTVKDVDYKCRLNAKGCVDLEKKLGTNPLNILAKIANTNELPPINELLEIIHASLQPYEHNMTMEKVYELYDNYCDEGNTITDLIKVIIEIFRVSGFINDKQVEEETKN